MGDVRVSRHLVIPEAEIDMTFSPSSGPGGQHANKASTRAGLAWNVAKSSVLSDRQRRRLRRNLSTRIDSAGVLRLSGDRHRSQYRNREEVEARLRRLVAKALEPPKNRVATRPTRASKQRRLQQKRRRSETKRLRRAPED